jgi:hypothetical protein
LSIVDGQTGEPILITVNGPNFGANGSIDILAKNDFIGGDAWLRQTWWDDGHFRLDLIGGYQFVRMDDSVTIRADAIDLTTAPDARVQTQDIFSTRNQFHGASIGAVADWRLNALSFELLGKIAMGGMRERFINRGRAITTPVGGTPTTTGVGLLVRDSNNDPMTRDRFAVVPELNANMIIHLNPAWRLTAGYSILYLSEAALAGDQIDRRIGGVFPLPPGRETTYLVQGMNLGLDYRW